MIKIFFGLCLIFFPMVSAWTVDLSEVKKILIENEVQRNDDLGNDENDIVNDENYAKNFGYQSFKEKNVTTIIQNGSLYLEGLSKALMSYRLTLRNCSINESTESKNSTSGLPKVSPSCRMAVNNSESIKRLSELALLTANKLRDKAYDKKYKDDDRDENELVLQLAWLLDRLAYLTGYEHNPRRYIDREITSSTPTTESNTQKVDMESLEILEQTENGRPLLKLPPKTLSPVKIIKKRSVNDPLLKVIRYYVKYKVWNNSNTISDNINKNIKENNNFDVDNDLSVRPIIKSRGSVIRKANFIEQQSIHNVIIGT